MRHRGRRRGAVPMLLVRRKPNDIARLDLLDRPPFALRAPEAGGDDQRLTEWMSMPRGTRTWLERDARATNTRWFRRLKQRINANCARKPISRPFSGWLCPDSLNFHVLI